MCVCVCGGVLLTHGCKGVPQVFLVDNAIAVLVNHSEGLWRAKAGKSSITPPCFALTPGRSVSGPHPALLLHPVLRGELAILNPSLPQTGAHSSEGVGGGCRRGDCSQLLCPLTSLNSWIWVWSNMEKTLELPPSAPALLLAFLGAYTGGKSVKPYSLEVMD